MRDLIHYITNNNFHDFNDNLKDLNPLNKKDSNGFTLLHIAAKYLRTNFIQALLDHGMDVDSLDKNKNTTLMSLLLFSRENDNKKSEIIQLLLENGANPNYKKNENSYSMLHDVIINKNLNFAKLLIRYGAKINEANNKNKFSPIFLADDLESLTLLHQEGANLDQRDKDGNTIISYLILIIPEEFALTMIRYFRQFSTTIELDLSSILSIVIQKHRNKIATYLIEEFKQSKCFQIDNYLIQSIKIGNSSIIKLLLTEVKDINLITDKETNRTALHYAAINNNYELIELLMKLGMRSFKDLYDKEPIEYTENKKIRKLLEKKKP